MVSVCLLSDALLQHLPSYLGFSYPGHGISLHSCSSKAQLLLLTLDEGYLLTTASPALESGIAPLGPPAPAQPPLLGRGIAPPGHRPWPQTWGSSSWLFLSCCSLALSAAPGAVAAWHCWPPPLTPRPRSGGCVGTGGPRGTIPRSRSGGATVRTYPSSKVRSSSCAVLEQP